VGIGSPHGSDAVGWLVVDGLDALLPPSVRVVVSAEPTRLLPLLVAHRRVWIVDACRSEQQVGTITRFAWPDDRIDRRGMLSGHGVGLAEVLELAETLGSIPSRTVVYTIDIGREPSTPDSEVAADVAAAVKVLRERLCDEVMAIRHPPSGVFNQTAP
jgi:hydrogenase maturation protease